MLKRKCIGCGKKIDKKFNFCPYCGFSFKQEKEETEFGMLGRDDVIDDVELARELRLPFGLDKLMDSLIKQLNKELSSMAAEGGPNGFKIQISTGKPKIGDIIEEGIDEKPQHISREEIERRKNLPKKEAQSNVRRLGDRIIYEISVPNVKSKKDVIISKLENSIEIKAYSPENCYFKTIPLKVEILGFYIKNNILFLELRG
ncbi:MAG: hypothetical protein ACOYT4_05500 [Nanoarchaeota archaeon]